MILLSFAIFMVTWVIQLTSSSVVVLKQVYIFTFSKLQGQCYHFLVHLEGKTKSSLNCEIYDYTTS